ncbi:hypothetical protein Tcan_04616 [Toxocara canis]|uniref:Uncharacterized protein n=2 Tax=Toxocara canis TaxID=6265 RepID=A0A0B2VND4_TOXCA|nr:hypothetical protein Tcan_04616 [Toxocara canis]VDM40407.1 unnamed protein product [Toxocara canis]
MDNKTSWVAVDMIDNETASTSAVITEVNDTTVPLQFDHIVALFNNATVVARNTTAGEDLVKALNILNIFEELPWLIWVIVAIGVLAVIGVVTAIITCIVWNKKRVIRKGSASDIRIIGVHDNLSQVTWLRCMICCPKSVFERREQLKAMRQNSASNLDPYKRPPLPPINCDKQHLTVDGYQGGYVPPHRLAPIRPQRDTATATVAHQTQVNVNQLKHNNIRQDELFGIQIAGIKGVPVIEISKDQQRELPVPKQLSDEKEL